MPETIIRCIAVDDESLALDLLEDNISKVPFLKLVKRCKNAFEAIEILQKEKIDLVFLDIQMPGITGIQFLQSLRANPMIIFITAYDKYALEGFELNVLDYLVKPVSFERFLKACNKALEQYNLRNASPARQLEQAPEFIFVNSEYNLVKIVVADITYVEGLKDYIKIYTSAAPRPVITRLSMKSIEERLPAGKFIRVHKSYIVSLDKITSIRKNRVKLGDAEVPISEHYRENLFRLIEGRNLA
jgi:DNA-binding LytR/AlgR family response regulator